MGCGPDVFRLFDLADTLVRDNRSRRYGAYPPADQPPPVGPSPREQLYAMYARGEVDKETFRALKELAKRGELRAVDVAVLRYEQKRKPKRKSPLTEEEVAIRQLQGRIAELEEAREESLRVLSSLQEKIEDVQARAQKREEAARRAVSSDEVLARRYLMEKQELLETQTRLQEQAQALQDDLAKLDDLREKLEAKVTELEALRSRQDIQSLRTKIVEEPVDR